MKQLFLLVIFTTVNSFVFAQDPVVRERCNILKEGRFKYLDMEDTTAYFDLDKENHIEYHRDGKYYIKSKIRWINDCQYEMTMQSNTIPGFPFKPGDVMIVTANKIEGHMIYYTSEVNGDKWKGRLIKLN